MDDPQRRTCAPAEYVSPFLWDAVDNLLFARISRGLSLSSPGEARNANSMDEVADSAWFTNRAGTLDREQLAAGACVPEDWLPAPEDVADGAWTIDHRKETGMTPGFRVDVPGKGKYLLKADEPDQPERASAAAVIAAGIYHALGFNTPCEQVVVIRRAQLAIAPRLRAVHGRHAFDDAALAKVLAGSTQLPDGLVRMQASKWLPELMIGPFRYVGVRSDDPNDVVAHEDRRELRGEKVLAAWLGHWDAREQNSMDVWFAVDHPHARSSPGVVKHYILDVSDALGGEVPVPKLTNRLGHTYAFDPPDIATDLLSFGAIERPWDRARIASDHPMFGYFSARDFDPDRWKGTYSNPAFVRATDRDEAWMARLIAKLSPDDLRTIVAGGRISSPSDADYLVRVLVERQHRILARYFAKLSPLGDVHATGDGRICATDFARLRSVFGSFRYSVVERGGRSSLELPVMTGGGGEVCFRPRALAENTGALAAADPRRIVIFEVRNGTSAGPLAIYAYDLSARGMRVVGLIRSEGK